MYAFITGASSGIGKAFSIWLAKSRYNLILIGRREERLIFLKKKLEEKYGIHVIIKTMDLTNRQDCFSLFEEIKSLPVTMVINNAGSGVTGFFTETSLSNELGMIDTNITAVHIFTKLFAEHMKHGSIINVSSMSAFHATPFFAAYGATKSYVYSLSTAVNYELKRQKKDVHITCLCPGLVDTEFYRNGEQPLKEFMISPKECARQGLAGTYKKKALVIPTTSMKLSFALSKVTPKAVMNPIQYFLQSGKQKDH